MPTAGQVASLTSSNNFINFCATVPNLPITNGQQIKTGSCNPAPMGVIAASTNMPSSKFVFPTNFATVKANTSFTVQMAIQNLNTGNFVNADENFFSAPQQIGAGGNINGHSHIVIESLDSLTTTTPTDPTRFAYFKGLNDAAVNGVLTADVTAGLPEGSYRLASINTASNHQPVLVAIAQHGAMDDMVYVSISVCDWASQADPSHCSSLSPPTARPLPAVTRLRLLLVPLRPPHHLPLLARALQATRAAITRLATARRRARARELGFSVLPFFALYSSRRVSVYSSLAFRSPVVL